MNTTLKEYLSLSINNYGANYIWGFLKPGNNAIFFSRERLRDVMSGKRKTVNIAFPLLL